jgi:hypothetical protein
MLTRVLLVSGQDAQDMVGDVVLDHQPAFRFGLALVIMLLLASNGWFAYTRSLSLADQYAHHAVIGVNQHFSRIFGFIDTIQSETINELQWGKPHQNAEQLFAALHNPRTSLLCTRQAAATLHPHGTGQSHRAGTGHQAGCTTPPRNCRDTGDGPDVDGSLSPSGGQGVAWVYYVSNQQFIYIYPFTSSSSYHYSPATAAGQFWRMASRQSIRRADG